MRTTRVILPVAICIAMCRSSGDGFTDMPMAPCLIRAHREKLHPGNRGTDNTRAPSLPHFKPFLSDSSPSCTLDRTCNDYGEWTSRRTDNLKMLFRCSAHRYRLISIFRSIPARVDLSTKRLLAGLDIL